MLGGVYVFKVGHITCWGSFAVTVMTTDILTDSSIHLNHNHIE